uniref:Uncharacterized protein n=1 Tax=viral metagenome TaxID=1070528 RepID=A0A2V0R8X5_9ZZZZ
MFSRTSVVDNTLLYAKSVAEAAIAPQQSGIRGNLPAPMSEDNVRMYSHPGAGSVTVTASTCKSAIVIFDPEASFRNGQANVQVVERDGSNAAIKVSTVNIGTASKDYISAGVISGSLSVTNSSGRDAVAGTQTHAVLYAVPKNLTTLSATQLLNAVIDKNKDSMQGVRSANDSTTSVALTNHFGTKTNLMREFATGNVVQHNRNFGRVFDGGAGSVNCFNSTWTQTGDISADLIRSAPATNAFFRTDLATGNDSPFTLATYEVSLDIQVKFRNETAAVDSAAIVLRAFAVDAAGDSIKTDSSRQSLTFGPDSDATGGDAFTVSYHIHISSDDKPIKNVYVGMPEIRGLSGALSLSNEATAKLTTYEQCSDVASRPIHVCVLDGLNDSATISISAGLSVAGVPDSDNAAISGSIANLELYDDEIISQYLKSVSRGLKHVYTQEGADWLFQTIGSWSDSPELQREVYAMKMKRFMRGVKKAGEIAKKIHKGTSEAARELMPYAEAAAPLLLASGNPAAMAAGGALTGGIETFNKMDQAGLIE